MTQGRHAVHNAWTSPARGPGRPRPSRAAKLAAAVGLLAAVVLPLSASSGVPAAHLLAEQLPPDASSQPVVPTESAIIPTATPAPAAPSAPSSSARRPRPKPRPTPSAVILPAVQTDGLGIPLLVLQAYHRAADRLASEQPSCQLPWWLLAGIGHTESGHAEGGRLFPDGTTRGRILGPVLDGAIPGDAVIHDTDHGVLDGDRVYDRAVGPMQFIPSTWQRWGADGNADGKKDPSNIFDATLAAGRYLCAGGRDLATGPGLDAAILSYNHSQPYLQNVLAWSLGYRDGAIPVPGAVAPVVVNVVQVRPPLSSRPAPRSKPRPTRSPSADATTSSPAPTPLTSSTPPVTRPGCPDPPSATDPSTTPGSSPTGTASQTASASPSASTSPTASRTPRPSETSSASGGSTSADPSATRPTTTPSCP